MHWWFLIGAVFFVLGGLLSVQPTKTQRRIAELRSQAMKLGLHVKLPVSLGFAEGTVRSNYPYYCKNLNNRNLAHQFVHVLRAEKDDEQVVKEDAGDGEILASSSTGSPYELLLREKLVALPSQYRAIYLGNGLLAISWTEATGSGVPKLLLDSLAELEATLSE